jgi:hypothetical protein
MVSTDAGLSWIKRPDTLDGWTRTALTPGTLHLVKEIGINRAAEKLYLRSTDLGNTWQKAETLSTVDGKFAHEHAIAAYNSANESSKIMVAWRDAKLGCLGGFGVGCSIVERQSYDNGTNWNNETILTQEPKGAAPSVALYDSNATVSWTNDINLDLFHVYITIRIGKNSSWCAPIDITPWAQHIDYFTDIALSSKAIHVVWVEKSVAKFQIFYRRGVFLTTDVKENNNELPKGFSLSQNYPNPFNPSTKIKYKLPSTEYVSIKVYDVFGREVATLVNEKKQPGEYEVEWNPSASFGSAQDGGSGQVLSSGVYFIRMVAGKYISTIKAISMK